LIKSNIILVFLSVTLTCNAQIIKRPVIIEPKFHTGLNIPFYKAVSFLVNDNIYAADLELSLPTSGKDYWEKLYNFPRTGGGLSYWTLGNDDVFGRAFTVYTFINVPAFKQKRQFSLNYQISAGAAYLTKRFDITDNHLNRAIGSHANLYLHIGIDGRINILPDCELIIEAGATHFSNSKTRSPNYGINIGSFSLGINYLFNSKTFVRQDPQVPEFKKQFIQTVVWSAGSKVYDNLSGKKYFVTSLTYNVERFVSHITKAGLGADLFYDGAISEALASNDGTKEKDFSKLCRFGLHVSYAAQYKRVTAGVQVGYYLYSKYTDLTSLYDRIFVQYHFTTKLSANVAIKTHYGKADFIEWGLGYSW
jgi:hypothetical protein